MKKIILIGLFVHTLSLLAAIPTMEGLFRNGANETISGNLAVFDLLITEQPKIQEVDGKPKENFLKIVLFQDENKSIKLYQFQYSDAQMSDQKITHFAKISNLSSKLKNDTKIERAIFYSFLNMMGLNYSGSITSILKKNSPDFKYNREVINGEKVALYRGYKNYLADKDKNPKESPLNPLRPEEKIKADELIKASMYRSTGNVKLIKRDGDFYWFLDLSRSSALFSNDNHFITEFKMLLPKGSIEIDFDDYLSLRGTQILPGQIMFKDSNERFYKIRITNFNISQTNSIKLEEKYKEIQTIGFPPEENSFPQDFLFL